MSTQAPATLGAHRQLTVMVGGQRYAMPGESVIEVLRRSRVTRVPNGPPALVGISNLRGAVLPVVSLARLMGNVAGAEERIVVLEQAGAVGLLVDAVLGLDIGGAAVGSQQIDVAGLLEAGFKRKARIATHRQDATVQAQAEAPIAQRILISFLVSGQTFALPLMEVIEALRLPETIAQVAGSDSAVLGVAKVRDRALPIISLRSLLGFAAEGNEKSASRVLVVDHAGNRIGLVADAVDAIVRLDQNEIDAVPPILQRGGGEAEIDAIGRQSGGRPLLSILSVPRLFANAAVEATVTAARTETEAKDENGVSQIQEQFVVFDLGDERYGVPIAAVQEVVRLPATVTRLPNGPRFISGVINLRGRPLPIIDQRHRFSAPAAAPTTQPRVIIVSVGGLRAGFVVDAVSEILSASADMLAVTPSLASKRSAVFNRVANIGEDGRLILLIDPEELLTLAEQDVIADIAAKQNAAGSA